MSSTPSDPLPRCCAAHERWLDLIRCPFAAYTPRLDALVVLAEINRARVAVQTLIPLDQRDQLETAELIARNRLEIVCGTRPESARLDPETHERAGRPAPDDEPAYETAS